VQKNPAAKNIVDVTLRLEEQNRNQLTFGAGVSQFEGFFGQLAFQTSNFMGRGESLTLSLQAGSRAAELSGGLQRAVPVRSQHHRRHRRLQAQRSSTSTSSRRIGRRQYPVRVPGGGLLAAVRHLQLRGHQGQRLQRGVFRPDLLFPSQGCRIISLERSVAAHPSARVLRRNPFVFDSLLLGQGGKRNDQQGGPELRPQHGGQPDLPDHRDALHDGARLAGLGGNTSFYKPRFEGSGSSGTRRDVDRCACAGGVHRAVRCTQALPIFERLFLGGEYSIRGFDIRSIGPSAPETPGLVLGGNKSLLFNAEYLFTIAGPVRLVAFFDAGQVRDIGQSFTWKEDIVELRNPGAPLLVDPFSTSILRDPNAPAPFTEVVGRTHAFKASTGVELRFFMPVLNVPFRLIYAAAAEYEIEVLHP
jgi:outer membrane protein assembly factor BamA